MSEKAPYLTGSVKKIWTIVKDRAETFLVAGISFKDLLICWIQNTSWDFLVSVKGSGQVHRIPFPHHYPPVPSCKTEPLVIPQSAAVVCSSFTKECAKHTSSWQLKTFLWRSQHIEVSKVYFGCKIYYLTFPRDMFWHDDDGLTSGYWLAAFRNKWLKHHSLCDLQVSLKSMLFSMASGSNVCFHKSKLRYNIIPHIIPLIYMAPLDYFITYLLSTLNTQAATTSCRCCVGCGAIWSQHSIFSDGERSWLGGLVSFSQHSCDTAARKLKQELLNAPVTPCCSLSILCAYHEKSCPPFTPAAGRRFLSFPPFCFTPCNFSFLEPSAGQGLLRWNLFNIWHFPTSYFSPSTL